MIIQLTEEYRVETDPLNYTVIKTYKKEVDGEAKALKRTIGNYGRMSQLVSGCIEDKIKSEKLDSISELSCEIGVLCEKIERNIDIEMNRIKKENDAMVYAVERLKAKMK